MNICEKEQDTFYLSFMYTTDYFWVKQTKLLTCKRFLEILLVRCIQHRYITLCPVDNSSGAPVHISESHCPGRASESLLQIS